MVQLLANRNREMEKGWVCATLTVQEVGNSSAGSSRCNLFLKAAVFLVISNSICSPVRDPVQRLWFKEHLRVLHAKDPSSGTKKDQVIRGQLPTWFVLPARLPIIAPRRNRKSGIGHLLQARFEIGVLLARTISPIYDHPKSASMSDSIKVTKSLVGLSGYLTGVFISIIEL